MPNNVLFSCAKNEGPFLLEWVAYHRLIGFDRIVIYSNTSNDGTNELLDALAENGLIEHYQMDPPEGVSAQAFAATHFNANSGLMDGDSIIWLDSDEFLNVSVGGRDVPSLLSALGDKKGALLSWRLFGDSGQTDFQGRFISEQFTKCSEQRYHINRTVKGFVRVDDDFDGLGIHSIHRPKFRENQHLRFDDFAAPNGQPLQSTDVRNQRWISGVDNPHGWGVNKSEIGNALGSINHYIVRTYPLFLLKQLRGRGKYSGQAGSGNKRHTDEFFHKNNRNEATDKSILIWSAQLTNYIKDLMEFDTIREAQQNCAKLLDRNTALAMDEAPPSPRETQDDSPTRKASKVTKNWRPELTFPDDVSELIIDEYAKARVILEYGQGGSTALAAAQAGKTVFAVENDPDWHERMQEFFKANQPRARVHLHLESIGPVKRWGRPKDNSGWKQYHRYPFSVWQREDFIQPQIVLIDGRFRTACFIASVASTREPIRIFFDDYVNRPHYHVVESLASITKTVGRMAIFDIEPRAFSPSDFWLLSQELHKSS